MEKILIVDDESSMIQGMLGHLEKEFVVVFAETEGIAKQILETEDITLILMDGNLDPVRRIEGKDVVKRLRERGCILPICMFSSDDNMNKEGVEAGADSIFLKKWSDDQMPKKLTKHVKLLLHSVK